MVFKKIYSVRDCGRFGSARSLLTCRQYSDGVSSHSRHRWAFSGPMVLSYDCFDLGVSGVICTCVWSCACVTWPLRVWQIRMDPMNFFWHLQQLDFSCFLDALLVLFSSVHQAGEHGARYTSNTTKATCPIHRRQVHYQVLIFIYKFHDVIWPSHAIIMPRCLPGITLSPAFVYCCEKAFPGALQVPNLQIKPHNSAQRIK